MYSISKDVVYCFPCKLFSPFTTKFATTKCSYWIHFARNICDHKKSPDNFYSVYQFCIQKNNSASFTSLKRIMLRESIMQRCSIGEMF